MNLAYAALKICTCTVRLVTASVGRHRANHLIIGVRVAAEGNSARSDPLQV